MNVEKRSFSVAALAEMLGGRVVGDGAVQVDGVAALDEAGESDVTFIADAQHGRRWGVSRAAAAVVSEAIDMAGDDTARRAMIVVPDAEIATAALLELFRPPQILPDLGVHPSAWVHDSVVIEPRVRIGPHASVERGCVLGADVVLHAGVRLYADVTIGAGSELHANCVVRQGCRLGRSVVLHQGVGIGADGFGYRPDPRGGGLVKIPHIGTVVIEDDVEIGAGSCVDRAKFGQTVIGRGTKIDNLVQIAHNCRIGPGCVIAGLVGIAGSTTLGAGVMVGGGAGISDHRRIGDAAMIAAHSGVMQDVAAGERVAGAPAVPVRDFFRQVATMRKMPGLIQRMSHRQGPDGGAGPRARGTASD